MKPLYLMNENIGVAHPADEKLIAAPNLSELQTSVANLSWLLNRGYLLHPLLRLPESL